MKRLVVVGLMAGALAVAGCEGAGGGGGLSKQTGGAVLGGVGGAVAGAQFGSGTGQLVATAAGALLGAFVGSEVGKSLDRADQQAAQRSAQQAFEYNRVGQAATWNNPDSGNSGTVTPTNTFTQEGRYCREYSQTVNVGGRSETAVGTACRNPDGTWQIVS